MGLLDGPLWWLPLGREPEIEAAELAAALTRASPPLLLDMRTPAEFQRGRIPGSRCFTVAQLRAALETHALGDDGRRCVALCLSAHRSLPAVRLLRRHGRLDAVHLAGGMRSWWKAGLPTEH